MQMINSVISGGGGTGGGGGDASAGGSAPASGDASGGGGSEGGGEGSSLSNLIPGFSEYGPAFMSLINNFLGFMVCSVSHNYLAISPPSKLLAVSHLSLYYISTVVGAVICCIGNAGQERRWLSKFETRFVVRFENFPFGKIPNQLQFNFSKIFHLEKFGKK
jgi:hypothetical protein